MLQLADITIFHCCMVVVIRLSLQLQSLTCTKAGNICPSKRAAASADVQDAGLQLAKDWMCFMSGDISSQLGEHLHTPCIQSFVSHFYICHLGMTSQEVKTRHVGCANLPHCLRNILIIQCVAPINAVFTLMRCHIDVRWLLVPLGTSA